MRAVVQRVSRARVTVDSRVTGEIGAGLMVLLGVGREDTTPVAASMAEKVANLRIFEDEQGKMNRSLLDVQGSALVVSQFTLYGDARGQQAFEISAPVLHALARRIGKNHQLAEQLWNSGIHEARILAPLVGESGEVTPQQMERWARDFDSWDVVDASCCYLYAAAAPAWQKAEIWSRRPEEFVKRAAFSLVAYLSYKDKQASDARFERFLRVIEREALDERNFVRKAVN